MIFEIALAAGPLVAVLAKASLLNDERSGVDRWLLPTAALASIAALAGPNTAIAVLAIPWTVACAYLTLVRLDHRDLSTVACAYLTVGAGWLTLAGAGIEPLDFDRTTVIMTGVHFHFAGFGALLIATEVARATKHRSSMLAAYGVGAALPVVAAGFTFSSNWLQAIGVALLGTSLVTTSIATLAWLTRARIPVRRRLSLSLSSLAILGGMGLALHFGISLVTPWTQLSWETMARTHGTLNATFVLLGTLGWMGAKREVWR